MEQTITYEEASRLVRYDPETGKMFWLTSRPKAKAGAEAGATRPDGYMVVGLLGIRVRLHRLAWLLQTRRWPPNEVDHVDRNPGNNRWCNLRLCSHSENHENRAASRGSTSALAGVYLCTATKKWRAQITIKGIKKALGRFDSEREAHAAYVAAKLQGHKFNPRTNP